MFHDTKSAIWQMQFAQHWLKWMLDQINDLILSFLKLYIWLFSTKYLTNQVSQSESKYFLSIHSVCSVLGRGWKVTLDLGQTRKYDNQTTGIQSRCK